MSNAPAPAYRRRLITIESAAGHGQVAGLEFGPADRPLDLLFLHANGFNAMTYRHVLGPMADLRILAVDQRGHGLSRLASDPADHQWQRYADDLLGLLQALAAVGPLPKVLGGHSMGGAATLLALPHIHTLFPAARPAVVLFDPVLLAQASYQPQATEGWWENPLAKGALRRKARFQNREEALAAYRGRGAFKTWPEAVLVDYLQDGLVEADADPSDPAGPLTLACAPEWEAANFAWVQRCDPGPALLQPPSTVQILRAELGSTCTLDGREAQWPADGRVTVETVPGSSHFLPMERLDLVDKAVRRALAAST